jgi:hypothetical protein
MNAMLDVHRPDTVIKATPPYSPCGVSITNISEGEYQLTCQRPSAQDSCQGQEGFTVSVGSHGKPLANGDVDDGMVKLTVDDD